MAKAPAGPSPAPLPPLPGTAYLFVILAFLLRLGARLYSGAEDFWANGYTFFFAMAQNIAAGNGIGFAGGPPTAFRVPLYPILLAGLTLGHNLFWPVLLAQALIGAATTWGAALLARTMFNSSAAVLAAAVTAIYPYYVIHDTALQETSLFTLLTLASVIVLRQAAASRSATMAGGGGLLLGLDVLTRATIAPFAALAPLWLAWRLSGSPAARLGRGLVCALVLFATLSAWLWRSYELTGIPTLSTEVGLELWNGNNALLFRHYPIESSDLSKAEAFDALAAEDRAALSQIAGDEARRDRWFLHRGLAYIAAHPWLTVVSGVRKIIAGFGVLPSPRRGFWPDLVHAFSYGPVLLLGLWGMWRRRARWREDLLIYALFLEFALVSFVFFAHTSHRSYLDVYLIVFAAGVATGLAARGKPPVP